MLHRGDDRAVTVQIGAVLLLAILFAALTLYQLNAVPTENEQVEYTHNQEVFNEMQDLRNAIQNVGAGGGTRSTSITLGTQYPSRTVAVNPPTATGTLETTGSATIGIKNASFAGDESAYEGDPSALLGSHETTTLAYRPDYNEYATAPTTRIEHGFAVNDFGDAQVSLTDQPMLSDGTIRFVALEGNLSESGSGAVALDPTALSGPSDEVPIEAEDGENVTLSVPTDAPRVWNESIGTTFDDGESDARVTGFDDNGDGSGTLTIELADDEYDLQVARVGIGDGGDSSDKYDVRRADGGGGGDPAYRVHWQDPSGQPTVDDENCDASSCLVTGDEVGLEIDTAETAADAAVEYAVSDPNVGSVSPADGRTANDGTNGTTFEVDSEAQDGDTVNVYTSSGSDSDRISLEISREPRFDVTIADTNDPVEEGEMLEVDTEVENTGGGEGEQTITFELRDENDDVVTDDEWTGTLESGETANHTFQWDSEEGDEGEYTAVIESEDDADREDIRVVEEGMTLAIDDLTITDESGQQAEFDVDWAVSDDDGNLETVWLSLENDAGDEVDDDEISVEGTEASGTTELRETGNPDAQEYTITLTVSDGETDLERTETVDYAG